MKGLCVRLSLSVCNNSYWFSCYCFVISQYKHIHREAFSRKKTKKKNVKAGREKKTHNFKATFFVAYKLIKKIRIEAKCGIVTEIDADLNFSRVDSRQKQFLRQQVLVILAFNFSTDISHKGKIIRAFKCLHWDLDQLNTQPTTREK